MAIEKYAVGFHAPIFSGHYLNVYRTVDLPSLPYYSRRAQLVYRSIALTPLPPLQLIKISSPLRILYVHISFSVYVEFWIIVWLSVNRRTFICSYPYYGDCITYRVFCYQNCRHLLAYILRWIWLLATSIISCH